MLVKTEKFYTVKLTRAAQALAKALEESGAVLATDYQIFLIFKDLYKEPKGLYLRSEVPTIASYRRARNLLIEVKKIARDADYHVAYRVLSKQDLPADEVVCLLDPFCYISHLSAMQRYGLTNRRPEALHLTVPAIRVAKAMIREKMEQDYGGGVNSFLSKEMQQLKVTHHPQIVRKRKLDIFSTMNYGDYIEVRGSHARVSSIGQTFLDMLEEPVRCGGMAHVLDVWQENARIHLDAIIASVDKAKKPIYKVRAGYILDEVMHIDKPEIMKWLNFVQRGGSRILDPSKPFTDNYSEKWMLSINV